MMTPIGWKRIPVVVLLATCAGAYAQDYPAKPIRLITSVAGGGPDFVSRLMAAGISGGLGQNVVVDNRGNIKSGELVAQAQPDGYTLLITAGSLWVSALMQQMPYDPVKDFAPITLIITQPNVLVATPTLPIASVKDLIAMAKTKPELLNYASSVSGATNHLAAELFNFMAGVKIQRVPYKGIGLAINDLISGRVQIAFPGAATAAPYVKSGKLKGLGVTGAKPSELLPGLPSVAEAGVPGYESVVVTGAFAPGKTPAPIIARLNREMVRFLRQPEAKEKFFNVGAEPVGSTPEELIAMRKSEMTRMGTVIKNAGIRAE